MGSHRGPMRPVECIQRRVWNCVRTWTLRPLIYGLLFRKWKNGKMLVLCKCSLVLKTLKYGFLLCWWRRWCFVLFFSDGIHLSPVGNKVVFKEVLKVLKEADWKPSLYWRSMKNEFDEDSPYDPFFDDGRPYNNLSNWVLPDNDYWD